MNKKSGYQRLIEAFTIFDKYDQSRYSVHAEHDVLYAMHNKPEVSKDDERILNDLGWHWDTEHDSWRKFT